MRLGAEVITKRPQRIHVRLPDLAGVHSCHRLARRRRGTGREHYL
jgi:hypothetical protein